jgi:hypothetical protein
MTSPHLPEDHVVLDQSEETKKHSQTVLNPKELMTKELLPGQALFLKIKWLESCETTLLNVYVPTTRAAQKPF